MKKAPRRYAVGGAIDGDPKKKKIASATGVNVDAKSADQQFVDKGLMNQTTANQKITQARTSELSDNNTKKYRDVSGISGAGGASLPKEPYQNELGTYVPATDTQYDKAGNVIPKGYKKGGTVKKMTKAPFGFKKK